MHIGLSIPISGVGVLNQVNPDMILGITSDTDGTFTLPLQNATTTITVDWGDASSDEITTYNAAALTHTYASTSTNYDITISGQFGGIKFNNGGDKVRLRNIQNWGSTVWSTCNGAFYGCTAMTITATDLPDTSAVIDFTNAWRTCTGLTSFPLIDTSSATLFTNTWTLCSGMIGAFPLLVSSSVTNFQGSWNGCLGLTSFPLIDTSSGTNFNNTWLGCTGLTSFPLIDTSSTTGLSDTWENCTGLTSFPLIDTSLVQTFNDTWQNCSGLTSFPLIDTSACTNFSDTWNGCTGLTSFPTINTSAGTIIRNAWQGLTGLAGYNFPVTGFDVMVTGQSQFASTTISTSAWDAILVDTDTTNANSSVVLHGGGATYSKGTVDSGTTDSTTASKLVDSTQNFVTTVTIGDIIHNTTDNSYAEVTAIDSDTTLSLDTDIMTTGETYEVFGSAAAKAKYSLVYSKSWTITDGGAADAWTPASLGADLALWLDADDAGTITLNGSDVAQWDDKSGNGNDVSNGAASTQPAYLATGWNGNPTVSFTATGQEFLFKAGVSNFASNDDFTLASAFEFLQTTNAWDMATGWRSTPNQASAGAAVLQCMSSSNTQIGIHNTDQVDTRIKVDVTSRLGKKIATVGRSGGTDGNGGAVTVTSTGFSQPTYQTDDTQTWTSAAATGFQVGGKQQGGTAYGDKYVSEVVGCNTKLSTENRQKLEGYLAWKWGLEANLPALHPYKNSPPTV